LGILNKIFQNQLFKVTSLNSLSILVRIITGFISSKAIAYFVGPSGMALMGNLRNFTSTIENIGILGLQN
jgi:PST family polysaccharide transporter